MNDIQSIMTKVSKFQSLTTKIETVKPSNRHDKNSISGLED